MTVIGTGPTGIETAAELAELGRTVTLVCGEVLGPYLHPRGRRSVAKRLAKLGVTVLEGPDAKVQRRPNCGTAHACVQLSSLQLPLPTGTSSIRTVTSPNARYSVAQGISSSQTA